jgi:hypothetical protein
MNDVALHSETCDRPAERPCPHCGSVPRPARLTLRWLLQRARADVFGLERGLLPTLWHLLVAPERVTGDYLGQGTRRYYGPFKYLLVATALSLLLMPDAPFFDQGFARVLARQLVLPEARVLAVIQDWNALLYAPFVLLLTLAMRGFFRARRLNLAEHLVLMLYAWAHMLLIGTAALLCVKGLKSIDIRGPALLPLLLLAPAWWFWYIGRVLRLRGVADWLRAGAALPGAFALFLLLVMGAGALLAPWLAG